MGSESSLPPNDAATLDELRAELVGQTIVAVSDAYGYPTIVLGNGRALDVETEVSCMSYCYGGSPETTYALRNAFEDEVPS